MGWSLWDLTTAVSITKVVEGEVGQGDIAII